MIYKLKMRRLDIYLFLFLIIVFFFIYHFYRYYEKDFKQIFQYVKLDLRENQYNEVQKQNRYYEVYKLAEETKKNKQQVIFLFNHRNKDTYDYSSTYFFNKDVADPEQYEIKHLSELGAVINYFFYPRIIKNYDLKEYLLYKPEITSDYIISDMKIKQSYSPTYTLEPIPVLEKPFIVLNKKSSDNIIYHDYYIYKVIHHE